MLLGAVTASFKLLIKNYIIMEELTDEVLNLLEEIKYMIQLRDKNKFTQAEQQKNKIIEMLNYML